MQGSGCRVQGSGFRVQGSGFRGLLGSKAFRRKGRRHVRQTLCTKLPITAAVSPATWADAAPEEARKGRRRNVRSASTSVCTCIVRVSGSFLNTLLLFSVYRSLFLALYLLFVVYSSLFNVYGSLFNVDCLLFTVYCSLFKVDCSWFVVEG